MRVDVKHITPEELAELRTLRDNVVAATEKRDEAQTLLNDEEVVFRAAVIRVTRRYGLTPGQAINLDTGAIKAMAAPAPNAGSDARSASAGERPRRSRAADPAANGRRGLRPDRGSRVARALGNGDDDAGHADARDAGA